MKGYLSIRETSYKWGKSERRVNQYVAQGPAVNIIDSETAVCLRGRKSGKQNFFRGKEKGTYIIFRRNPNILRRVSRNATPFYHHRRYSIYEFKLFSYFYL